MSHTSAVQNIVAVSKGAQSTEAAVVTASQNQMHTNENFLCPTPKYGNLYVKRATQPSDYPF